MAYLNTGKLMTKEVKLKTLTYFSMAFFWLSLFINVLLFSHKKDLIRELNSERLRTENLLGENAALQKEIKVLKQNILTLYKDKSSIKR